MGAAKGSTLTTPTHPTPPRPAPKRPTPGAALAVAIDGGNSKTEVVVLAGGADGLSEQARVIGAGSGAGPDAVATTVAESLVRLGVDPNAVTHVAAAVAGLDFPGDESEHRVALQKLFSGAAVDVVGDAIAVLEAGAGGGEALAIVCGAGLNAVARGPRGLATVPALGWASGDWGGGDELGREAVRAAARAADGRGTDTVLVALVLADTGAADMDAVARAIRDGSVSPRQVGALAAAVACAAAQGDAVAAGLIARVASEALLLAEVVARRAWPAPLEDPSRTPAPPPGTPAILAGGMYSDPGFLGLVSDGLRERGFEPRLLPFRPVDGLVRFLGERVAPAASTLDDRKDPR
jgi:N-acetylglucosamine kinase-like BadF-type ATPase